MGFLDRNWKAVVFLALVAGLAGMLLHSYLIIDAAQHTGEVFPKYVQQINYNFYGEGDFELFMFPGLTVLIGLATYLFAKNVLS